MWITRRVLAILAVVASLFLVAPAPARADGCEGFCRVGLQGRVVQLVADGESTCALTENGDVYCWSADYPDPHVPARNPLLLITVGALLVAAGTTLLMLSRPSPTARRRETPKPPA
ncbi:hypothetical protein ACIA5D_10145 [Actinoplanes sp. NPDC051513]|uniref:hypothetical protein n=1 Tax=Actinoplanes sp. NPDC051513 TaxID=3363908 RepID=UPI0037A7C0A3